MKRKTIKETRTEGDLVIMGALLVCNQKARVRFP